jgi:hypothetical protein
MPWPGSWFLLNRNISICLTNNRSCPLRPIHFRPKKIGPPGPICKRADYSDDSWLFTSTAVFYASSPFGVSLPGEEAGRGLPGKETLNSGGVSGCPAISCKRNRQLRDNNRPERQISRTSPGEPESYRALQPRPELYRSQSSGEACNR